MLTTAVVFPPSVCAVMMKHELLANELGDTLMVQANHKLGVTYVRHYPPGIHMAACGKQQ